MRCRRFKPDMPKSTAKLPVFAQLYLDEKTSRWSPGFIYETRLNIRHFHSWLSKNQIDLRDLTPIQVKRFQIRKKGFSPGHYKNKAHFLREYLEWLIERKKCHVPLSEVFPDFYEKWDRRLPLIAQRFQESKRLHWAPQTLNRSEMVISRFHNWLERNNIPIKAIKRKNIEGYLEHLFGKHRHRPSYVQSFKVQLRMYLEWLENEKVITFEFRDIFPRSRYATTKNLDQIAHDFLSIAANTKKPKTCSFYKTVLVNFYTFAKDKQIQIYSVDRNEIESWLSNLLNEKLCPATRVSFIINLRAYFYWLHERGIMKSDPHQLIRVADLPNRPKLLPRPLPLEIDQEIQRRLENSNDIYHRTLFLMRRTGIRIGEAWSLPFDCVRQDELGHWSLKVPLGKLDSERLVPINDKTLNLIRQIQEQSKRHLQEHNETLNPMPLLVDPGGFRAYDHRIRIALQVICRDLKTAEPIVPHRLRHTFATELLNGGMSLHNLMKVMGHRTIITTLIYAAVTQETVRDEYFAAVEKIKTKYSFPARALSTPGDQDPVQAFADVITWLKKGTSHRDGPPSRKIGLILKRLNRLKLELDQISNT